MDTKGILNTTLNNILKPLILVLVIYYCVDFLIDISKDSSNTLISIVIITIAISFAFASLIRLLFHEIITKINSRFSISVKLWLLILRKNINYLNPLILGILIYYFMRKGWLGASLLIGILLLQKTIEIIKEEMAG